jgi:hypothetical protein
MKTSLYEFKEEVIEFLCDLEGYAHDVAVKIIQDKEE